MQEAPKAARWFMPNCTHGQQQEITQEGTWRWHTKVPEDQLRPAGTATFVSCSRRLATSSAESSTRSSSSSGFMVRKIYQSRRSPTVKLEEVPSSYACSRPSQHMRERDPPSHPVAPPAYQVTDTASPLALPRPRLRAVGSFDGNKFCVHTGPQRRSTCSTSVTRRRPLFPSKHKSWRPSRTVLLLDSTAAPTSTAVAGRATATSPRHETWRRMRSCASLQPMQ